MYTYMYIHVCVYIYIYIYMSMHYTCAYTYIHTYVCVYIYIYVYRQALAPATCCAATCPRTAWTAKGGHMFYVWSVLRCCHHMRILYNTITSYHIGITCCYTIVVLVWLAIICIIMWSSFEDIHIHIVFVVFHCYYAIVHYVWFKY